MKKEDIYNAITDIEPELIEEADNFTFRKKRKIFPAVLTFAAVFLIVFAVSAIYNTGIPESFESYPDHIEEMPQITTQVQQTLAPEAVMPPVTEVQTAGDESITTEDFSNPHISSGKKETKPMTLKKAVYPERVSYPFLGETDPRYDEWAEDRRNLWGIEVDTSNIVRFSKNLMSELLTDKQDENNIVSPLNLYMTLAMLAEACDGNSRQQILNLLKEASVDTLRDRADKIWQKNYRDDGAVKSVMANSLWLNDSIMYKKSAVTTIAQKYYASVFSGTMGSENYNKMLNSWIKENTGGLLDPDIKMQYQTVMSIASTLLFSSKWTDEFHKSNTESGTFHAPAGDKTVSFMNATRNMYYCWGEKYSAVSLNLNIGGKMWFILPDEGVDADEIFKDSQMLELVTGKDIYSNYENAKYIKVNLSIPKFDVKSERNVIDGLKNLGVTDVTDELLSDFSPLATNPEGIFIDRVDHGVRVKIDEEGVEAAAYTVIRLAGSPAPPDDEVDFILDRPFAFVITLDNETPLFAGVVNNP